MNAAQPQSDQPNPVTVEWEFRVPNKQGLHLRVLRMLAEVASAKPCHVELRNASREGEWINGKSIMGMALLQAGYGCTIQVRCKGEGGAETIARYQDLVERRFDEDQS